MSIAPAPRLPAADTLSFAALIDCFHIWILPAHDPSSPANAKQSDAWLELLSTDELARAGRFHFAHHAAGFVANRARLRILLGRYLDLDPKSLAFRYGPQGKPSLAPQTADVSFNLSHTEGCAMVALTRERRVGIDIERIKPAIDLLDLARQNFSDREIAELLAIGHPERQQAAFYHCWTRKEAFLKALGDGLTRPLSDFTVSCDNHPALLQCAWEPVSAWQLLQLDPGAGYAAALAYDGSTPPRHDAVKIFEWAEE